MAIISLSTKGFRNLKSNSVLFDERFNIVHGENGSGKTSLLEAISLITSGRSFRTRKLESIIKRIDSAQGNSPSEFVLFGEFSDEQLPGVNHKIGLRKSKVDRPEIRINGGNVSNSSTLAEICPSIVIEPGNISLLTGAAQARRKYIDWTVFHVEHSLARLWRNYLNCLKQRNALLKKGVGRNKGELVQLDGWNQQTAMLAEQIDQRRKSVFAWINEEFAMMLNLFLPQKDIKLSYRRGWDKTVSLVEALEKTLETDLNRGYTSVGAHRMDVRITIGGKPVTDLLSRGQLKILALALYLAQIKVLYKQTGKRCLVMLDDLTSELDSPNTKRILDYLKDLESQVICTTLDMSPYEGMGVCLDQIGMFHVEHGEISPL